MTEFEVKGPYNFRPDGWPRQRVFTRELAKAFRIAHAEVLSSAGCYVFALKASHGFKPWYIGKTTGTFAAESLTTDKLQKYNESLSHGQKRGTPVLFFLLAQGRSGASRERRIQELELFLIQLSAMKNPLLINVVGARGPDWGIRGILRTQSGAASRSSSALKKVLSL